jgi:hypothetical protein
MNMVVHEPTIKKNYKSNSFEMTIDSLFRFSIWMFATILLVSCATSEKKSVDTVRACEPCYIKGKRRHIAVPCMLDSLVYKEILETFDEKGPLGAPVDNGAYLYNAVWWITRISFGEIKEKNAIDYGYCKPNNNNADSLNFIIEVENMPGESLMGEILAYQYNYRTKEKAGIFYGIK